MASGRHVIVAGGGIAGLTAALCLSRAGLRATVLEQSPKLEETGAGIQLSPNATRILLDLGLHDYLAAAGDGAARDPRDVGRQWPRDHPHPARRSRYRALRRAVLDHSSRRSAIGAVCGLRKRARRRGQARPAARRFRRACQRRHRAILSWPPGGRRSRQCADRRRRHLVACRRQARASAQTCFRASHRLARAGADGRHAGNGARQYGQSLARARRASGDVSGARRPADEHCRHRARRME